MLNLSSPSKFEGWPNVDAVSFALYSSRISHSSGLNRYPLPCLQTLPVGCHRPEPEPVAPEIDSWARGAIPLKTHVFALTSSVTAASNEADPSSWTTPEPVQGDYPSAPTGTQVTTIRGSAGDLGRRITEHGTDGRVGESDDGEDWDVGFTMLPTNEDADLIAGYGGITDAIMRGRRREERMFLEVGWTGLQALALLFLNCLGFPAMNSCFLFPRSSRIYSPLAAAFVRFPSLIALRITATATAAAAAAVVPRNFSVL